MERIDMLRQKVDAFYKARTRTEDENWANYLHTKHVFVVADTAGELADRFGAQRDLAMAAGMLHDIADAVMIRRDPQHEEKSIEIADRLLDETGFSPEEKNIIIGDAIKNHSCRGDILPQTLEGKVMATADAVAHLLTDFYEFAISDYQENKRPAAEIREWGLEKTSRDFNKKIFFPEVQEEARADYERLKVRFEALT